MSSVYRLGAVGIIEVKARYAGTSRVAWESLRRNTLTDGFFDALTDLLRQPVSVTPSERRIASLWFEGDNPDAIVVDETDTGPQTNSVVVYQHWFDEAEREEVSVSTDLGTLQGVKYTASLDGTTYAGSVIQAAGLYTKGSLSAAPDPETWTPGLNNVHLVARQALGPWVLRADFVFDVSWTIAFGRLPAEIL